MEDCKAFLYVFQNHWCNVHWEKPIEKESFPEMKEKDYESIQKDPKKRAEADLDWGFSLEKYLGRGTTEAQSAFIAAMVERLSND